MNSIPSEAITAAADAISAKRNWAKTDNLLALARCAVEAAAPLVAAAERQRILGRLEELGEDLRSDIAAASADITGTP